MKEPDPIVFVIDDDRMIRDGLQSLIKSVGLRVQTFASAQDFLGAKRPDVPACLVLDVRMPGLSGLDLQLKLRDGGMSIPIIFITGHGDIPMSVLAMKEGTYAFDQAGSGAGSAGCSSKGDCKRASTAPGTAGTEGDPRPIRVADNP